MIRYHRISENAPRTLLVSSRRIPRGYIILEKRAVEIREVNRNCASVRWDYISGFKPVGFDGRMGKFYPTREAAVEALLSRPELNSPEFFDGRCIPNPKPVRCSKKPFDIRRWFREVFR